MPTIDIDALLLEVEPAAPCGPNLEYDPAFLALEQAVAGKPEVQYGNTITPAVPPEWKAVRLMATELLQRSRDLRVAMPLLHASLSLEGIAGLANAIKLIERLLDERWASVHPQLDPEDGMDPTSRINSLAQLTDSNSILKDLKETVFVMLPGLGPLSLRTLEIANGELPPAAGEEKLATSSIEAALSDVDTARVLEAAAAMSSAFDSVAHIEATLVREVGAVQALNLDHFRRALKRGRDFLAADLAKRPDAQPEAELEPEGAAAAADGQPSATAAAGAAATAAAPAISGEITNRSDVLRVLDKLLKYYQQYEPSSPVPLFLGRAKKLVPKTFMEIMEELAPDGMAQLLLIKGNQGETQE